MIYVASGRRRKLLGARRPLLGGSTYYRNSVLAVGHPRGSSQGGVVGGKVPQICRGSRPPVAAEEFRRSPSIPTGLAGDLKRAISAGSR